MSERTKPKVSDKEKAQMLFELGDADNSDLLDEVDDADDDDGVYAIEEMFRTTSLTDRARIIDVPAPGVVGGFIQIASSTVDPASMREFRDSIMGLVQNEKNGAHHA